MAEEELPAELSALERALGAREILSLPDGLRARVLSAAAKARTQSSSRRRLARTDSWTFAAGAAAAILFWINFSMSAVSDTSWGDGRPAREAERRTLIAEVHEVLPELSDREAWLHALLLEKRTALIPAARTLAPLGREFRLEEDPWATP